MTSILVELREKWLKATNAPRGGHEWRGILISAPSRIRVLAGVREPDERIALIFETSLENARNIGRFRADGFTVTVQRKQDEGILRIAITLELEQHRNIFEVLAIDIIQTTIDAVSESEAVTQVSRRLDAWQSLLHLGRNGLSKEQQVGLFGELLVLEIIAQTIGWHHAIEVWQGPMNGLHDFSGQGCALEVKATLGPSNQLQISRLNQLECSGLKCLILVRPRFVEDPQGQSLKWLIASVRQTILRFCPSQAGNFEDKLLYAGYADTLFASQDELTLSVVDIRWYEITPAFPKLPFDTLPTAIVDGQYAIDERAVQNFTIDAPKISASISGMTALP